jgi:prepilin-type N-terminal cleavage/methylation domain-containing protein
MKKAFKKKGNNLCHAELVWLLLPQSRRRSVQKQSNQFSMTAGFTLAEVLITLGIIGVVAALTIPALVASYQEKVLKTQFKKLYATASIALQKTYFDMDENQICGYLYNRSPDQYAGSGCIDFFEEFAKNLDVVKTCKGNAFADGCLPDYSAADFSPAQCCDWYGGTFMKTESLVYVLKDGSIIVPYSNLSRNAAYGIIGFDVNGKKGPNKPGENFFALRIVLDGSRMFLGRWDSTDDFSILVCLQQDVGKWQTIDDIMN